MTTSRKQIAAKPSARPGPPSKRTPGSQPHGVPPPEARSFRALLEPDHTSLKWTMARVPFDAPAAWPHMLRRRVAGSINGQPFRTSLFPAPGNQRGEIIIVNKQMQAAAHAHPGDRADFILWPDLAERPAALPPELIAAFDGDKALQRWTLSLSDSDRREIAKWIDGVKSAESRAGRAAHMAERLLLTMEAERETPPILELAFRANPRARSGWLALTPNQRRRHLLGIFYYQTPEARSRRAEKALEDALRAAAKSDPRPRPDS